MYENGCEEGKAFEIESCFEKRTCFSHVYFFIKLSIISESKQIHMLSLMIKVKQFFYPRNHHHRSTTFYIQVSLLQNKQT